MPFKQLEWPIHYGLGDGPGGKLETLSPFASLYRESVLLFRNSSSRMRQTNVFLASIFSLLRSLSVCIVDWFGSPGASAQFIQGEEIIQANDPVQITDAVMITEIAVNGNPVEFGLYVKPPAVVQPVTPFLAGNGWLQQMTISLINRTNKTIVFGAISLQFLDTGDCRTQPCRAYSIHLGQVPIIDNYSARTGEPLKPERPERSPLNWELGQTIVVRASDYLVEIKGALSNLLPVTAATKVAVHIGPFFFDDGMMWNLGFYSVPDPEHHGKFKYMPDNYFPGKRGHNWPPGYDR